MKQIALFGEERPEQEQKYTTKIKAPIYEPRGIKPHILELCDTYKANQLIREIDNSQLSDDEKQFLKLAAHRHIVFNYEKIADYYANSQKEMQQFMERSALVIIDFDKAIELGFIKLTEDITKQYCTTYE